MKIIAAVIAAIIAFSFLTDPFSEPVCPFILLMYAIFNILCSIYDSSKETYEESNGTWKTLKTDIASFFGYDLNDYRDKRYERIKKNSGWADYKQYSNKKNVAQLKEYNEVVKFLDKTAKIDKP